MEEKYQPIGMLDSGVGGLTVAREVSHMMGQEEIIYYGDTLHLPYGPRSLDEVRGFVFEIIDFLLDEKKAKAVVLACNTATSAALEEARNKYDIPIFGTIDSVTQRAYELSENKKVGVIGTEGTINSQAYQNSLLDIDSSLDVYSAACPEFVSLVEQGTFNGPNVEFWAYKYLAGLCQANIDVLILGCTHFPYLIPVLQNIMGPEVTLLSSGEAMAQEIKNVLAEKNLLYPKQRKSKIKQQEFLVSDQNKVSEKFLSKGRSYLELPALEFEEYNIFE